jgi:hypothetical protein
MTSNGQRKRFQFLDLAKSGIETGFIDAALGGLALENGLSVCISGNLCPIRSFRNANMSLNEHNKAYQNNFGVLL